MHWWEWRLPSPQGVLRVKEAVAAAVVAAGLEGGVEAPSNSSK